MGHTSSRSGCATSPAVFAAYVQNWDETALSRVTFGIAPRLAGNRNTNDFEGPASRHGDVYVFSVLAETNRQRFDPIDVSQWKFYVVGWAVLDARHPDQKTISLTRVRGLADKNGAEDLPQAVGRAAGATD